VQHEQALDLVEHDLALNGAIGPSSCYHVASGTPVVTILRPARTPKGTEVRTVIKHVTKRMRRHWPKTRIVWRGDSHYGRVEAMEWAEDNDTGYIFGVAGNTALDALVAETADNLRFHHAISSKAKLRTFASFTYKAGSWKRPRKVVARLECSLQPVAGETGMRQEVDIRYVVTSLEGSAARITLPHFSVSSAMCFPNSVGVIGVGTPPEFSKPRLQFGIGESRINLLVEYSCRREVSSPLEDRDQRTTQRRNRGCQRNPTPQTTGGATTSGATGGATTTGATGATMTGPFGRQRPYGPR
jgi:hypothetical protein